MFCCYNLHSFRLHFLDGCMPLRCFAWLYRLIEHPSLSYEIKRKNYCMSLTIFFFKGFIFQDGCLSTKCFTWPHKQMEHVSSFRQIDNKKNCMAMTILSLLRFNFQDWCVPKDALCDHIVQWNIPHGLVRLRWKQFWLYQSSLSLGYTLTMDVCHKDERSWLTTKTYGISHPAYEFKMKNFCLVLWIFSYVLSSLN